MICVDPPPMGGYSWTWKLTVQTPPPPTFGGYSAKRAVRILLERFLVRWCVCPICTEMLIDSFFFQVDSKSKQCSYRTSAKLSQMTTMLRELSVKSRDKFTTEMRFNFPEEQPTIPVYRVMDTEGVIIDTASSPEVGEKYKKKKFFL